jgi:hypothetical protein
MIDLAKINHDDIDFSVADVLDIPFENKAFDYVIAASLLNIVFGLVLLNLKMPETLAKWASWFTLGGLLMPLGILSELYLGLPPYLVVVGGISIFLATVLLAIGAGKSLSK